MQEILIVKSVLDYINDHSKEMNLPCELELEDIAPKGLSMSLQQISGEKYFELGRFKDLETAKAATEKLSIIKERYWSSFIMLK